MLLRRLAASTPEGAAGSVTQASAPPGSAAASQSSSGTFPWILDSGASFHMTLDRTSLSSISTPSLPFIVQTADVSSLCCRTRHSLVFLFSCSCCFLCSQTDHAAYLSWPAH